MFDEFTDRAKHVILLAEEAALSRHHGRVGAEHILLGLVDEPRGIAAHAPQSLGISPEVVRSAVEEAMAPGHESASRPMPFTSGAKRILERSLRESVRLGHNYIGTEHLLLALPDDRAELAAQVLITLGVDRPTISERILDLLREGTF